MPIKTVGVVGCGLMGSGIAQVCAEHGFKTFVREVSPELIEKGFARIRDRLDKAVEKGKATAAHRDTTMANLKGTTALADLRECDLVIEAAVEDLSVKRQIFTALDAACPPATILASNTSSLCVTEMAALTKRPDRFCGIHFFNPVPVMKLVEIVRALSTTLATVDEARAFILKLEKTPILTQDTTGFVVNRLLVPYLLEAVRLLDAGVATKEDIDIGMKLGCGHPMGPLELLDFVGLDTTYYIANIMFDEFREARFAPPPMLKRMVLSGRLGRKSGRGFYEYPAR